MGAVLDASILLPFLLLLCSQAGWRGEGGPHSAGQGHCVLGYPDWSLRLSGGTCGHIKLPRSPYYMDMTSFPGLNPQPGPWCPRLMGSPIMVFWQDNSNTLTFTGLHLTCGHEALTLQREGVYSYSFSAPIFSPTIPFLFLLFLLRYKVISAIPLPYLASIKGRKNVNLHFLQVHPVFTDYSLVVLYDGGKFCLQVHREPW